MLARHLNASHLTGVELRGGHASSARLAAYLFGVVVHHAGEVVDGQADLVLPLAGLGSPEPDLVLAELTGDVRDDLPHVQTLTGPVVPPVERSIRAGHQLVTN